jgi:hypothetical protein
LLCNHRVRRIWLPPEQKVNEWLSSEAVGTGRRHAERTLHRGKTVIKPLALSLLGLLLSEKQIPQVVENLESGGKPKEALERAVMRPRQAALTG